MPWATTRHRGADIFKEGHDVISAVVKWRQVGQSDWQETALTPLVNDRWQGTFPVTAMGAWEFTVEAWGTYLPFLAGGDSQI